MSVKSYTLADNSTVTVAATEQGISFNEGMDILTKAIKARVNVRDSSLINSLVVDDSNYTGSASVSSTTIEGGIRITLDNEGYIDVTY